MISEPHEFARKLRQSSTKFEDMLWQRLRGARLGGAKFKRQVPFGSLDAVLLQIVDEFRVPF